MNIYLPYAASLRAFGAMKRPETHSGNEMFKNMENMRKRFKIYASLCIISGTLTAGCAKMPAGGNAPGHEEETGHGCFSVRIYDPAIAEAGSWSFNKGSKTLSLTGMDTSNFILSIYSQEGTKVYDGKYGKRPESFSVSSGCYNVKLLSKELGAPEFNNEIVGDSQDIVIEKGRTFTVELLCRQMNAGVRINFSDTFKKHFPALGLYLKDFAGGIQYPYNEKRFCFLQPGAVDFYLRRQSSDSLLFTRKLNAADMLDFNFDWSENTTRSDFSISIDTTRNWYTERYNPGSIIPEGALTIEQAKEKVGQRNITVFGYILGGDVKESTFRTGPPFSVSSNLLLAPSMSERYRNNCFAIELPSGAVRDALNLVVHPHLVGSAITVTGTIVEQYFGYIGMKSTKACEILK